MIPDDLKTLLIADGYGEPSDPMVVEIAFDDYAEFVPWCRDNNVSGRYVDHLDYVDDASIDLLYYVPELKQYLFTKMRWS